MHAPNEPWLRNVTVGSSAHSVIGDADLPVCELLSSKAGEAPFAALVEAVDASEARDFGWRGHHSGGIGYNVISDESGLDTFPIGEYPKVTRMGIAPP